MRFLISQKEQLQLFINYFGEKYQKVLLFEEMSELQKEICKDIRNKRNIEHIAEELADVYIMLQQMQLIYGITDEQIEQVVQEKIERTLDRIDGECNESK